MNTQDTNIVKDLGERVGNPKYKKIIATGWIANKYTRFESKLILVDEVIPSLQQRIIEDCGLPFDMQFKTGPRETTWILIKHNGDYLLNDENAPDGLAGTR